MDYLAHQGLLDQWGRKAPKVKQVCQGHLEHLIPNTWGQKERKASRVCQVQNSACGYGECFVLYTLSSAVTASVHSVLQEKIHLEYGCGLRVLYLGFFKRDFVTKLLFMVSLQSPCSLAVTIIWHMAVL